MKQNMAPSTLAHTSGPESRQARMDVLLGSFLLIGLVLSVALILIGLTWNFAATGQFRLDYRLVGMNLFQLLASETRFALHGEVQPRFFINVGIALLMLTPFLRVVVSVAYFMIAMKSWKYTLFTAIVLVILTFSLFIR
jgi:uncharacterized membrane protein